MSRITAIALGTLLIGVPACSDSTGTDDESLPLQGVIEARVSYHEPGEIHVPTDQTEKGVYLRLISRWAYPSGCYTFRTSERFQPPTYRVDVRYAYPRGGQCTAELASAQSWFYLGDPGDGTYALYLADPEEVYVGLLEVKGTQLTVTFPDTTRFNFYTSIFP